jgi:gliding motility-associated-like protein
LNLTVTAALTGTETASICQGDSLLFGGVYYKTDNTTATKTVQTASGCDSIVTLNLTVNNQATAPTVTISNNGIACVGDAVLLSASSVSGAVYVWTLPNNDTLQGENIVLDSVTLADTGVYSVQVTVDGCTSPQVAQSEAQLSVNLPPSISLTFDNSICGGDTLTITAETNAANATYTWMHNGTLIAATTDSILSIADAESLHQGFYTVRVTDDMGCQALGGAAIFVNDIKSESPQISNSGPTCEGGTIRLEVIPALPGAAYSWTGPNGFALTDSSPVLTRENISLSDTGDYILTVSVDGCTSEADTTTVNANGNPVANAGDDIVTRANALVRLQGSGGLSYNWSPAELVVLPDVPNPVFFTETPGTYNVVLTVTDEFGCTDNDTVQVIIMGSNTGVIDIPDLITPNGDGFNDTWNLGILKGRIKEVSIYARGGSLVMQTTNYNDWDGTYKGKPLPDGAYWYVIKLADETVYKGSLTIKR